MLQFEESLTDDASSFTYNRNMFKIQAAEANPKEKHPTVTLLKWARASFTNIRLGRKDLSVANTLVTVNISLDNLLSLVQLL